MPSIPSDLDEVHHLAGREPVDEVAERATQDERERDLARQPGDAAAQEQVEDDASGRDREDRVGKFDPRAETERDARVASVREPHELAEDLPRRPVRERFGGPPLGREIQPENPSSDENQEEERTSHEAPRRARSSFSLQDRHSRACGMASRRARAIGSVHDSHTPYSPR